MQTGRDDVVDVIVALAARSYSSHKVPVVYEDGYGLAGRHQDNLMANHPAHDGWSIKMNRLSSLNLWTKPIFATLDMTAAVNFGVCSLR